MVEANKGKSKEGYQILSGLEAISTVVPDIPYVIEQKLRKQAKILVIGKWKQSNLSYLHKGRTIND